MANSTERSRGEIIAAILGAWFLFALAIGAGGYFENVSAPVVAVTVWGLVALVLLAWWKIQFVHDWVRELDLRVLVAIHVTRLVGFYFLLLGSRGELPMGFAKPAGIGDAITAIVAIGLLVAGKRRHRRAVLRIWNFFGFIDILFVVFSALRFGLQDPQSMAALRALPLSLLPMFFVPLIIASHVLIFVRLTNASK